MALWHCLAICGHAAVRQVMPDPGTTWVWFGLVLGFACWPVGIEVGPRRLRPWLGRIAGGAAVATLGHVYGDQLGLSANPERLLLALGGILLLTLAWNNTAARVWRLIRVEWSKLWRSRLFRVGLLAAAGITLLAAITHEPMAEESGWALATRAMGAGFWAAELLLLVLGATTIAGELAQGTLKMILPHAYRRSEWIAAKTLVLIVAAAIFAAVVLLVAIGHTSATSGFGDITKAIPAGFGEEDGRVEVFRSAAIMSDHLREAWASALVSLMASGLLGLLFSSIFSAVVPALSATFLLFLGVKSADVLLGVPRSVMQHVHTTYPEQLREWLIPLGRGINERWDPLTLPNGLWVALLTGALAWLLALALFDRRDLHG
jgi:hypothetical protein